MGSDTTLDPVTTFFEDVAERGYSPLLHHLTGSIRLDLLQEGTTEHWYLTVTEGDIKVSHKVGRADIVMRMDRELFQGMVKGTINAMAALLRGTLEVEGDLMLLNGLERLFPGPPASEKSFMEREKALQESALAS